MIKIIIDSTVGLTRKYCEENNLTMVSLHVNMDGKSYEEGFSDEFQDLMKLVLENEGKATTSQPSPEAFYREFVRILDEGDDVLYLSISSCLSGTYNSANIAKSMLKDEDQKRCSIIDTQNASGGIIPLLLEAIELVKNNSDLTEVTKILEEEKKKIGVIFTVDNLDTIMKSGRVSKVKGTIANLLRVKPMFVLDEGKIVQEGSAKGKNSQIKYILDSVNKNSDIVVIASGSNSSIKDEVTSKLKETMNANIISISMSSVILCNGGSTALAIFYKK